MASAQLSLNGTGVNREFRQALFDAANRAGVTPNEFCITAAAEKLIANGRRFPEEFAAPHGERGGLQFRRSAE